MSPRRAVATVATTLAVTLAFALLASPASARYERPKPPKQLRALKFFLGAWKCTGTLHEMPGRPAGTFTATTEVKITLDGHWAIATYVQHKSKTNPAPVSAMFIYGYDTKNQRYVSSYRNAEVWQEPFQGRRRLLWAGRLVAVQRERVPPLSNWPDCHPRPTRPTKEIRTMKRATVTLATLATLLAFALPTFAATPEGTWKTIDDETKRTRSLVKVYKKADGKITRSSSSSSSPTNPRTRSATGAKAPTRTSRSSA